MFDPSELLEEINELDESVDKNQAKVNLFNCTSFYERMSTSLVFSSDLKNAIFVEGDGDVSLIIQSLLTNRRVNCSFFNSKNRCHVFCIDENMKCSTRTIDGSSMTEPREIAAWVMDK